VGLNANPIRLAALTKQERFYDMDDKLDHLLQYVRKLRAQRVPREKTSRSGHYAARRWAQGYSRFYATLGWRTRKITDIFKQESSLSILRLRALEQELVQEY
jgi:hypothetical protein